MKKSEALHKFYKEVTTAGKPEYLPRAEATGQITSPEELQQQLLEEKIKEFWRTLHIDPQLVRQEVVEDREDVDLVLLKPSVMSNESLKNDVTAPSEKIELTDEQKQEILKLYEQLKKNSRWLPDSALTTYYGKPAFHAYGNANTQG